MRPPSSSPCDQPWAPDKEQTWKTSASSRIPVLAAQPFNQLLGATLSGVGPSRAELKLPITREIEQQHGCVHGGVISYLVDTSIAPWHRNRHRRHPNGGPCHASASA
jgi:acyl-coenzyme A thioesterase PaaI-like protein